MFMSQIAVYTTRLKWHELTGLPYVAIQVLLVLCGIWSLDFLRSVIPPFCVSSHIKTIHALALEYLVAFYPIFLILFTYVCIKLHDNNFRPVVWLWKPSRSQTFCSLEEEMGLHHINNQCFHNIFASCFLQNFICIFLTLLHTFTLNYDNFLRKLFCILTLQ